jgi:hypothetical protein
LIKPVAAAQKVMSANFFSFFVFVVRGIGIQNIQKVKRKWTAQCNRCNAASERLDLLRLFRGRSQLLVYHFMFGPACAS